jgi:hypothetical protein
MPETYDGAGGRPRESTPMPCSFAARRSPAWVALLVMAICYAGFIGWACVYVPIRETADMWVPGHTSAVDASRTAAVAAGVVVLGGGLLALYCGAAVWLVLERKRARVTADEAGMAVTDWRGRERRVSWSEIVGMRVVQLGSRPGACVIRLADGRQRLGLSVFLDRREALIAMVASQAGLERQERWFGYTYQRRAACSDD